MEFIKATGLQIWQDANIMGTQKKKKKYGKLCLPQIFTFYDKPTRRQQETALFRE